MSPTSATAILAVPLSQPEKLFTERGQIDQTFKRLAMAWHPDHTAHPQAGAVSQHLIELRNAAKTKDANGTWGDSAHVVMLGTREGVTLRFRYRVKRPFELGEVMYGSTHIAWIIGKDHLDLAANGIARVGELKYQDKGLKDEFARHMPQIVQHPFLHDGGRLVIMRMPATGTYMLADVLKALGGKVPATAAAWMTSRLLNLACFLNLSNLAHNGIGPETIWVNPAQHTVALFGGWWYATPFGEKLQALPALSHRYAPRSMIASKLAAGALDSATLRATVRAALGDESGMGIDAPAPMTNFLRSLGAGHPVKDFARWDTEVLKASFGPRRFVKLDVDESAIFNPL